MGTILASRSGADVRIGGAAGGRSAIVRAMHVNPVTGVASEPLSDSGLEDLLRAVALQDRHSFEKFYDLTVKRAMGLVVRITQDINVAEEVVSDVYLQIWHQADRFDPVRGNAMAWLTVLCRSRALDTVRRNNAAPTTHALPMSEIPEPVEVEFPQDLLIAIEDESVVHHALEQLRPEHRQLLALAYFRGYSHSELAAFTGMPIGTVKTQLRRTVQKMKELVIAAQKESRCRDE